MKEWDLSVGFYPGFLIGVRTYPGIDRINHVFYLPLIDLCITIYHDKPKQK